jgi:hypothetical protein
METMYNNPTEAAKGIRSELKAAFPGTKFSVRTSYFSMGNSIDISWDFGPTCAAVDAIVKKYQYGRFDSMTDCSSSEDTLVSLADGSVKVLGGAKFVQTQRNFRAAKGDYSSETAFWERVQRDLCALQGIEYAGRNTPFYANSDRDSVSDIAYRVISRADLSNGYNGLRRDERAQVSYVEERIVVIPEGEVAAPAPVSPAPASQPAAEIAPEVLEVHIAAAMEIITHIGTPIRTMRAEARRAAVAHRCYIRYPALDRELVMRAVLTVLVCEMTGV